MVSTVWILSFFCLVPNFVYHPLNENAEETLISYICIPSYVVSFV